MNEIRVRKNGNIVNINISEVIYFCHDDYKIIAVTADAEYTLIDPISLSLLAQIYSARMLRIHRSYLVAKLAVKAINRYDKNHVICTLINSSKILPVGRDQVAELLLILNPIKHIPTEYDFKQFINNNLGLKKSELAKKWGCSLSTLQLKLKKHGLLELVDAPAPIDLKPIVENIKLDPYVSDRVLSIRYKLPLKAIRQIRENNS